MKPDAVGEWERISAMAQAPAQCSSRAPGSRLPSCPEAVPKAAPEAAKPAETSPKASKPAKASSPPDSVVNLCLPLGSGSWVAVLLVVVYETIFTGGLPSEEACPLHDVKAALYLRLCADQARWLLI